MEPYYEQDGIRVYHGDNREVVPALAEQFAAVCTDPPYGLSKEPDAAEVLTHWLAGDDYRASGGGFMGRSWDAFVPGPATWRVIADAMLPGAHLAAFSGTRTYDLMGMAIRLAGMHYRETLAWMFGSGFPKSHDVSKAIDRAAGKLPPEGKGFTVAGYSHNPKLLTTAPSRGYVPPAPATPEAARWEGWGTALKPAYEPIILARKPLSGTVASNVLAHGTGAINIDACRIGTNEDTARKPAKVRDTSAPFGKGYAMGGNGHAAGRWPANVVLDERAAEMLDAQSGERGNNTRHNKGRSGASPFSAIDGSGRGTYENGAHGYGDTGGASRFFKVVQNDTQCLLCLRTYAPKHDIMNATQEVAGCNHASSAAQSSLQNESRNGSAPDNVQEPQPHESVDSSRGSDGNAITAALSSGSTPRTRTPTAVDDALAKLAENLVPRVKSAANLCNSCVTATAQSLAATLLGQTPASPHGLDSMPSSSASILIRSLASYAEPMVNTGIIPTTASLSTLFGSVAHAIAASTSKASSDPTTGYVPTRFLYQSKASRRERNAGLDGLPERHAPHGNHEGRDLTNPKNHLGGLQGGRAQNHHPTVKPLALMRWLLTLVTPPGGVVLDPFAGSGSTGVAAAQLGIPCVLIEQEAEYLPIIAGRVDHALDERRRQPNAYQTSLLDTVG